MQIKNHTQIITLSLIALTLTGCASMGPNENAGTAIGGLSGAAVGAAVSHNVVGAGVGALAGGLVGGAVGRQADDNSYNDY